MTSLHRARIFLLRHLSRTPQISRRRYRWLSLPNHHSPATHWVDSFEQPTDPSETAPVKGETKNIFHVNSREN
ncbi:hypothetical protein CapIbe_014962 [Capra ibex]